MASQPPPPKRKYAKPLSLYPMSLEDALKRVLKAKPEHQGAQNQPKRQK